MGGGVWALVWVLWGSGETDHGVIGDVDFWFIVIFRANGAVGDGIEISILLLRIDPVVVENLPRLLMVEEDGEAT